MKPRQTTLVSLEPWPNSTVTKHEDGAKQRLRTNVLKR